jgi:hypothetical protein
LTGPATGRRTDAGFVIELHGPNDRFDSSDYNLVAVPAVKVRLGGKKANTFMGLLMSYRAAFSRLDRHSKPAGEAPYAEAKAEEYRLKPGAAAARLAESLPPDVAKAAGVSKAVGYVGACPAVKK